MEYSAVEKHSNILTIQFALYIYHKIFEKYFMIYIYISKNCPNTVCEFRYKETNDSLISLLIIAFRLITLRNLREN